MTTNAIIRINSEDTNNGYVQLNQGVSCGSQVYGILTWTQSNYNITSPAAFVVDATTVYLPVGFYTQQQACSTLQSALGANYTVSPDAYSKKVTITNVLSAVFTITGSACDTRLMDLLGFSKIAYSGASIYVSQSVGSGGYKGCGMNMRIDMLDRTGYGDIATRNQGTFMFIPANSFGTTSTYADYVPIKWLINEQKVVSALGIKFMDFYGAEIDFNGGSWVLQIVLDGSLRNSYSEPNW